MLSSAFFRECEFVSLEPFHGHVNLGGCFGQRAPGLVRNGHDSVPADPCQALLVMPFSPETATDRQNSTDNTSHDKIAPSQQMEAAVMPDLARCCGMYVKKGGVPCLCNIRAPGNTVWSWKLSCLDML